MDDRNVDELKDCAVEFVTNYATFEDIILLNEIFRDKNPNTKHLRDIRDEEERFKKEDD